MSEESFHIQYMSCLLLVGWLVGGGVLQSNLALTQRDNTWGRCSGLRSLSKRPLRVLRVLLRRDGLYLFSLHMLLDLGEERGSGARKGGRDLSENEASPPHSVFRLRLFFLVSVGWTLRGLGHRPRNIAVRLVIFCLPVFFLLNHLIFLPEF